MSVGCLSHSSRTGFSLKATLTGWLCGGRSHGATSNSKVPARRNLGFLNERMSAFAVLLLKADSPVTTRLRSVAPSALELSEASIIYSDRNRYAPPSNID